MKGKKENRPQSKKTGIHKINQPVSPTTKTPDIFYRKSKAIKVSNNADLLEHITIQNKLEDLIEEESNTRHVLTLVNSNFAELIGLFRAWMELQRTRY